MKNTNNFFTSKNTMSTEPLVDGQPEAQMSLALFEQQPEILKKPVQAIHMVVIGGQQSRTQRLAFNAMLKHAHEQQARTPTTPIKKFSISRLELMRLIGYTSPNRKYLKETLTRMQDIKVQWDFLKQDGEAIWGSCVLLPFVGFSSSNVYYSFGEEAKPILFDSKVYARLDIGMQRKLSLDCSAALFDWVNRFRTNPSQLTNKSTWTDWRWAIHGDIDENSSLNDYKIFKRDKLKPAMKEINDKTDLTIELIEDRDGGRSVRFLQFKVTEKEVVAAYLDDDDPAKRKEWDKRLAEIGIAPKERKKLLTKYSIESIEAHYQYTMARVQDTSLPVLRSIGAYMKHALEAGFATSAPRKEQPLPNGPESMARLLVELGNSRTLEAGSMFDEMFEDQREEYIAKYNETLESKAGRVPATPARRTNRHMVPFFKWLSLHMWGEPTAQDAFDYGIKHGLISINGRT